MNYWSLDSMKGLFKAIFILSLLVLLSSCGQETSKPATEGRLVGMDGKAFALSSLKGKWVVINYWASWCHPCKKEIPELNAFYQAYKDHDVVLFGVNYDGLSKDELPKVIQEAHISYPNLLVDPAQSLQLGNIPGIPATYVFSPQGVLQERLLGEQTQASLKKALKLA